MKRRPPLRLIPFALALLGLWGAAAPAAAYVGPGAAITLVGGLWALLVAVLLAVAGMLIWPIRALLRSRRRDAGADPAPGQEADPKQAEPEDSADPRGE